MPTWTLRLAVLSMLAAACAPQEYEPQTPARYQSAASCLQVNRDNLYTTGPYTGRRLTVATGDPAFPPWWGGGTTDEHPEWELNDPYLRQGYEGAVTFEVAERLGFSEDQVAFVPIGLKRSFAPGPKDFDLVLQQIPYRPELTESVDFSESYFDVNRALVSVRGSAIADATSLEEVKDAALGAKIDSTSLSYIEDTIQPTSPPAVYDDLGAAVQDLKKGQVDGNRGGPAERVPHHGGADARGRDRRPVPGRRLARALRDGVREGEPPRGVREPRSPGDEGRRHARRDPPGVAGGQGRRATDRGMTREPGRRGAVLGSALPRRTRGGSMRKWILALAATTMIAAACGEETPPAGTPTQSPAEEMTAAACAESHADDFFQEGTLTIGTDVPAFQPWVAGTGEQGAWEGVPDEGTGNPYSGEGFESAVAYAIADQLGFTEDQVEWVVVPFNNSYAPGPKDFDFDINQVSVTPEREASTTFSDGYYDVSQALVVNKGTPIADATSIADLKTYQLGVQIGTTSLDLVNEVIQPEKQPRVFDRSVDVIQALNNEQIDGYVVDAPTAYVNVLIGQAENGVVVGQFPEQGEHFGLVFEKDNPLVECVNIAIAALEADGTLQALEDEWLADLTYPVLQ
jgi:polar amino acid transport system substrate-binding protein